MSETRVRASLRPLADLGWEVEPTYGLREESIAVSLYFGKQANGMESHQAFVYHPEAAGEVVEWSITKLDKWGGIGSRAPVRSGKDEAGMACLAVLASIADIEARQKRSRSQR